MASEPAAQPPGEPKSVGLAVGKASVSSPKSPLKEESKSPPASTRPEKTLPGKPAAAKAPPGPWSFPGAAPVSRSLLLGIPEVVDEIALGEAQRKQLTELLCRQQAQLHNAFVDVRFQEFRDLPREDREKRLSELRKKVDGVNKTAEAEIAELLSANQLARLDQIRLQREGMPAMTRPEIARQLGLTDQQQEKIRRLLRENRAALFRSFDPNATASQRREATAQMQKQLDKTRADILASLTAAQQAQWTQMKGKAFVFPQPRRSGGPPRGKSPAAPAPPSAPH